MRRSVSSERTRIAGPVGSLEALIDQPQAPSSSVAVICHPHPLHGGTMDNKVAHTLARTFYRMGVTAVRFNFRGVGGSAGSYADGVGEREDLLAVAAWSLASRPGSALFVAGFSFGATVALRSARQLPLRALVAVAPPVSKLGEAFEAPSCPWLIVHGEKDELVPLQAVREWHAAVGGGPVAAGPVAGTEAEAGAGAGVMAKAGGEARASLAVVPGATHFFHGKLNMLAEQVESFIRPQLTEVRATVHAADGSDSGR